MGLIENVAAVREEQRVIASTPWMPWLDPRMRFDAGGPAHPSRSYHSPETALGVPALYAGVKLLASAAASLTLRTFIKYNNNGVPGRRLWTGPSLLDDPSLYDTQFSWIYSAMASAILQGNCWGYIGSKDSYGFPRSIDWLPPEDVWVQEARDRRSFNPLDAKVYVGGSEMRWHGPDAELFHIKGFPIAGRLEGVSLLTHAAMVLTGAIETQRYGNTWYESGGFPPGTFQNSEIEVNAEQADEMRAQLVKSLRRREPLVYGRDWDFKPVIVPPNEAQFIQATQLSAAQIAAMLNIPANRVGGTTGDSLHYSSQAQDALQILESLRPYLRSFEQSFSRIIPANREADFNTDDLLMFDLQTRMQIYQIQRDIGFASIDEQRALEDKAPLGNDVGAETLPLQLMVAMGTRAGAIPKSMMKSVVLEMDIATDRLIKLEKTLVSQGKLPQAVAPQPGQGGFGAAAHAPGQNAGTSGSGGNDVSSQGSSSPTSTVPPPAGMAPIGRPNQPLPLAQDPASFLASLISVQRSYGHLPEVQEAVNDICSRILQKAENIERAEGKSELVTATDMLAPWISTRATRDIVLS